MPGLSIGWDYLTGYAVATNPGDRTRAEWPPHPARVFMALAAAWFETAPDEEAGEIQHREHSAEGNALRWLESLGDPDLVLPDIDAASERSLVTAFVPVNDRAGPSSATLQSAPALTRSRQARTFPRIHVGDSPCFLHWPKCNDAHVHRPALERLCAKVSRIGHSSSLVCMWLATDEEELPGERWAASTDDATATQHLRVVAPGLLDTLPLQTQIPRIETFAAIKERIDEAEWTTKDAESDPAARKAANQALKQAKAEFEDRFGQKWKKAISPPPLLRPRVGLWSGYRRIGPPPAVVHQTHFDGDVLVLTRINGPHLSLTATLAVTTALRDCVMRASPVQPVPAWISGHDEHGRPLASPDGHLACIPLPFIGGKHADGHLLGAALVFPRTVDRAERGRILGKLLLDEYGAPREVALTLGKLGVWRLRKSDWNERRRALLPESWTAARDGGERTWSTATPIVLDRFPKSDRGKDPAGWRAEAAAIIVEACRNIGLPAPEAVDIDTTAWQLGSPRATGKRRRLRDQGSGGHAPLGDGFPPYPPKGGAASRPQVHAWLRFPEPVFGPLLLGAGRYRGYGLCAPLIDEDGP